MAPVVLKGVGAVLSGKRLAQEEGYRQNASDAFVSHNKDTSSMDLLQRCKKLNEFLSSDFLKGGPPTGSPAGAGSPAPTDSAALDPKAQLREILSILNAGSAKRPSFLDRPPVTATAGIPSSAAPSPALSRRGSITSVTSNVCRAVTPTRSATATRTLRTPPPPSPPQTAPPPASSTPSKSKPLVVRVPATGGRSSSGSGIGGGGGKAVAAVAAAAAPESRKRQISGPGALQLLDLLEFTETDGSSEGRSEGGLPPHPATAVAVVQQQQQQHGSSDPRSSPVVADDLDDLIGLLNAVSPSLSLHATHTTLLPLRGLPRRPLRPRIRDHHPQQRQQQRGSPQTHVVTAAAAGGAVAVASITAGAAAGVLELIRQEEEEGRRILELIRREQASQVEQRQRETDAQELREQRELLEQQRLARENTLLEGERVLKQQQLSEQQELDQQRQQLVQRQLVQRQQQQAVAEEQRVQRELAANLLHQQQELHRQQQRDAEEQRQRDDAGRLEREESARRARLAEQRKMQQEEEARQQQRERDELLRQAELRRQRDLLAVQQEAERVLALEEAERVAAARLQACGCIQRHWRGHRGRSRGAAVRLQAAQHSAAVLLLQACVRSAQARKRAHMVAVTRFTRTHAACVIQRWFRSWYTVNSYSLRPLRLPRSSSGRSSSHSVAMDGHAELAALPLRVRAGGDARTTSRNSDGSDSGVAVPDAATKHRTVTTTRGRGTVLATLEKLERSDTDDRARMAASHNRGLVQAVAAAKHRAVALPPHPAAK
ncbi:MAG: hypothetical protein WDW36_006238 [Sanguina aurantia]